MYGKRKRMRKKREMLLTTVARIYRSGSSSRVAEKGHEKDEGVARCEAEGNVRRGAIMGRAKKERYRPR